MIAKLVLAVLVSFAGAKLVPYKEALAISVKEDKPMLVVVGAKWCAPCQQLKSQVQAMEDKTIVVTYVDADESPEIASQLMDGDTVPQVLVFRKVHDKWLKVRTVGMVTKVRIVEMIRSVRK